MQVDEFEVVISAIRPEDSYSLEEELERAAVRVRARRCLREPVVIDSRQNGVFSAEDVLEVVAEWISRRPGRAASTSIAVRRSPSNSGLAGLARWRTRAMRQRRQLIESGWTLR